MMSFFHRFSQEASNAFQDMYGNVCLGDDAGKSARLTLVIKPQRQQTVITTTSAAAAAAAAGSNHNHNNNNKNIPNNKTPTATTTKLNLGMTFIEVNGRAYVQSVIAGSHAAKAGVMPQDAIQYAAVFQPGDWEQHNQQSKNQHKVLQTVNEDGNTVATTAIGDNNSDDDDDDLLDASEIAIQHALRAESSGVRITYEGLRKVLADSQSAFISPPNNNNITHIKSNNNNNKATSSSSSWHHGPPIPSTVNICVPQNDADGFVLNENNGNNNKKKKKKKGGGNNHNNNNNNQQQQSSSTVSSSSSSAALPVVFILRRTRQRRSLLTNHFGMLLPSFRLDDECDFASSLVKRLAPTADMEIPDPGAWEELVHDGTDWLLGNGSMLPPKIKNNNYMNMDMNYNNNHHHHGNHGYYNNNNNNMHPGYHHNSGNDASLGMEGGGDDNGGDNSAIPLDSFERERATKLADLRSKMAAEAIRVDRTDDVEAATIRGMIQKAVGLAFVRATKMVLGVSVHGGSGIVISRLSDGTWSAPSAIGTWGLGLGLQFGLEMAEYIFILQTQESLDHFRSGGSFTIGGNIGAAVAGIGREAYGAASAGGTCGGGEIIKDDEYNDNDSNEENKESKVGIAPIVAYAKSQGLYIGVSLEGSRIFARNDINSRTYKFTCGRDVSAYDILSGKVPTPPEAEDLYAALHSVEFTHEMSCLPRPPEILRKDSPNSWYYDRSTLGVNPPSKQQDPFNFLRTLSEQDEEACETFETQFKKFMYGGVSVQRLLPNTESRSGRTGRERRTLWLMLPETGSLRLGFVSKLSDGEGAVSNKSSTLRARRDDSNKISTMEGDLVTVESEEVTLDSALYTDKDAASTIGQIRTGNVQLSQKHSVALTDLTILSHDPLIPIKFNPEDKTEHLRVISLQDVAGTSLLFLANNFREAELLMCGLKLLLERETARLGVRGGLPISALGGRVIDGAMSPSAARGWQNTPTSNASVNASVSSTSRRKKKSGRSSSGYISSDVEEFEDSGGEDGSQNNTKFLPEGRKSWGRVPGRSYMRGQAASMNESKRSGGDSEQGVPQYVHGQLLVRDIAKKVRLPLPLPLCRVLLLDSTSPVIARWEKDRGDMNFDHTLWTFPPATPRELERHASEHSLIATGSMCGAHRTSAFDRMRNGTWVRLSETQIVDADDSEKLAITVSERMPRRGFSIKIRILLRAVKENACDATVFAEIRPVGKDMSNQAAVHRAFNLVINEIKTRYGEEPGGLMAGFLNVIDNMGNNQPELQDVDNRRSSRPFPRTNPTEEKKSDSPDAKEARRKDSGLVSFEDMLKTGRQSPELLNTERPSTPSIHHEIPEPDQSKRLSAKSKPAPHANEFAPVPELEDELMAPKEPVLIEVKPLPKIRLSLMPSPREEDEDNDSSYSPLPKSSSKTKKKKSTSKRKPSSSWRKSGKMKNKF